MTSPDKLLTENRPPQPQYLHGGGEASGGASWSSPQHTAPNPASSPVPPGFTGGGQAADAQTTGERLRQSTGSLSAPPPPGFKSDSSGKMQQSSANHTAKHPQQGSTMTSSNQQHLAEQRSGGGSALSAEMAQVGGGRTSSFVNLAAVLGTGLAESMEDATKGEWSQQLLAQQPRSLSKDDAQDLSYARHSRHAAARMIGTTPPHVDSLGLNLGGNFPGGAPPTSLGGGGHPKVSSPAAARQENTAYVADSNSASGIPAGYLSSTFSNPGGGDMAEDLFGMSTNRRGQFPISKDLGVTVMEPGSEQREGSKSDMNSTGGPYTGESGGVLAALMQEQEFLCNDPHCPQTTTKQQQQQHQQYNQQPGILDRDTFEAESAMRSMWLGDSASAGNASRHSQSRQQQEQQQQNFSERSIGNSSTYSGGSQTSRKLAEAELRPFLWDTHQQQFGNPYYQQRQEESNVEPSRCLAIMRATHLQVPEIRTRCEAFGVLESFRSDFADRGIFFVSYYDIRSAQYAALELEAVLKRRDSNRGGGPDPAVYYCVPLNCSTQTDESRLVITDVPPYVDENSLLSMLSSYGAVRSLKKQGAYYGGSSFEAEFNNVQDAKQALMELSSTQPWGPDVAIEVGMRSPIERKRGRELLAVIGRWRHGAKVNTSPNSSVRSRNFEPPPRLNYGANAYRAESSASSSPALAAPTETTQLVLGPDGRYSYVVVNNQPGYPRSSSSDYNPTSRHEYQQDNEQPKQQIVHGPNGEIYITTILPARQQQSSYRQSGQPVSRDYWPPASQQPHHADNRERISGPYYPHHGIPSHQDTHGVHHQHQPHHPHSSNASAASTSGDDKDNKHLVLELDAVEQGRDTRTSLMVRNIPNKYTQQMLLAEFTENGLGPGVIDFFYLPIDFKNRCNRGYAFINFVDFKDILPFHRRYFGKHWSTFNSDKICDITYARIQGKAAMLKRFENSALMEKDEEYKPLVFISHGPEKGKRIPFPEAASYVSSNKTH